MPLPYPILSAVPFADTASATLLGLDVSEYQGDIDFAKVKAAGASFVFIKATEGTTIVDPKFATNWKAAQAAGIVRSAYHFFRPMENLQSQIDSFVATVSSLAPGDLPPVLDVEVPEDWTQFTVAERVAMVTGWLQGVESKLGIKPIIYIDSSMVEDTFGSPDAFKDYLLWVADWTDAASPDVPKPWTDWTFWQYSDVGTIDGIDGDVDLDRFAGSLSDLQKIQYSGPLNQPSAIEAPKYCWVKRLRDMIGCKH